MMRVHNTNKKRLRFKAHYTQPEFLNLKPTGLWYSFNHEWVEWANGICRIGRHLHILYIDESKILIIRTADDLKQFIAKYKIVPWPHAPLLWFIDWESVAKDWGGIEIQNYSKIKRETWSSPADVGHWFITLDVSSGCIWDLSILNRYRTLVTPKKYRE
jgi:hypothetical protein